MRLPEHRIEEIPSKDKTRYALNFIKLDVEKQRLLASDGKMMAVVPLEKTDNDPDDKTGPLTVEAIKAARKRQNRQGDGTHYLLANGDQRLPKSGLTFDRPEEVTFPDFDAVDVKRPDGPCTIALDAELLFRLAKAISSRKDDLRVKLHVRNRESAIYIESVDFGEGAHGVLMPIIIK